MQSRLLISVSVVCLAAGACKSSDTMTGFTGNGGNGSGGASGGSSGAGGGSGGSPGSGGGAGGTDAGRDAAVTTDSGSTVMPSAGCGKAAPTPTGMIGTTSYGRFTLTVPGLAANATNRVYYVRLPASYDASKPYSVVYLGPGCNPLQDTVQIPQTYPLEQASMDNAILVEMSQGSYNQAPYETRTCPTPGTDLCAYCFDDWAEQGATIPPGEPIERAYFDVLHKTIEASYCVDKNRQFYGGYSSGGWLAQQLGCWFPDVLRAQANVTGGLPPPIKSNVAGANDYCVKHPIAAFLLHNNPDTSNVFQGSVDSASRLFALNGCTGTFSPPPLPNSTAALPAGLAEYTINGVANSGVFRCYKYTTCPTAYPIVFCVSTDSQHTDTQSARVVPGFWEFFSSL
jgi:hypothetical protein